MRKIFTVLILALFIQAPTTSYAQELILNDGQGESVVSGIITDIRYKTFLLSIKDDTLVRVNIESLDIDTGRFDDYFNEGMRVQVFGDFDDDEIEASKVIKLSDNGQPNILTDID